MGGEREETVGEKPKRGRSGGRGGAETVQGGPSRPEASPPGPRLAAGEGGEGQGQAGLSPAQRLVLALEEARGAGNAPPVALGGQKIRMHESGGQIHFHDDAAGLKAGVPVGEMWGAWQRLLHLGAWTYLDSEHGTLLAVCSRLEAGDVVECYISLAPCKATNGPTMAALERVIGR